MPWPSIGVSSTRTAATMADRTVYEVAAEAVADTVPWANDETVPPEQRAAFVADIAGEEHHRVVVDAVVRETCDRIYAEVNGYSEGAATAVERVRDQLIGADRG
jgi:hypothetical protein